MFPQHMLKKLYIPESLKNTDGGFEFSIKNVVDSTSLYSLGPIVLDEEELPIDAVSVQAGEKVMQATEVSNDQRLPVYYGTTLTIRVAGQTLTSGDHVVRITVRSIDVGQVKFEVEDTVK